MVSTQLLFQFFVAFFNDDQSLVVDVVFLRFYRTGTTEKKQPILPKNVPFFAENIYTDLEEEVLEVEVTPELEESCSSANRTFR